ATWVFYGEQTNTELTPTIRRRLTPRHAHSQLGYKWSFNDKDMLYAKKTLLRILIFAGALSSCGELFLDVKPDQRQRAPKTTEDFQALLDHSTMYVTSSHALGMIGADEYFVTAEQYNTFRTGASYNYQKNA